MLKFTKENQRVNQSVNILVSGVAKVFKSNENRKKHATKKFLLTKGKLNSKEKIKSKVLIDTEISHEGFTIIKN